MAEGFRAAQAFVEVSADVDDTQVLAAARRAASQVDAEMRRGAKETGRGVAGLIGDGIGSPEIGARAAKRLTGGISKGARSPARDAGKSIAGLIGDGMMTVVPKIGGGLIGTISQAVAAGGPAVGAGVGIALLAAAPAIVVAASTVGAMVSGALVSGLGLAAMTGGIALALRDDEILEAATTTGEHIMRILNKAAVPFQSQLMNAFALAEGAMKHWEPQIKRIFSLSATFVEPLTRGLTRMVDKMLPGMVKAIAAIQPAIDMMGEGLSWVGREIGYMFKDLSDNGPELAMAIGVAFAALVVTIRVASVVLNALTETFGFFVDQALSLGPVLQSMGAYLKIMPGPIGEIGTKLFGMGAAINQGRMGWEGLKNRMTETINTGEVGIPKLTTRQIVLTQSMREGVKAAGDLNSYFKVLNGTAMGLEEAESQYQAALDAVATSIKENGKTTDIHTAKGRANLAVLRDIKTASEAKAQAAYDEAVATGNVVGAEKNAKAAYEAGRAQLIKARMAMGDSRAEATAYANRIMKIPKNWNTTATIDTAGATSKLNTFIKKVTNADGKVVNVTVRVTTKGDHYIPGVGTQLKAAGGWIQGGSGTRDDVPVLAMGGEFMLRRRAASALERQFGKGFLDRLNWWDRPGSPRRPNVVTREPDPMVTAIGGVDRPDPTPTFTTQQPTYHFAPGAFTVDLSRIKDVGDLVRMVQNLTQTARAMGAAA